MLVQRSHSRPYLYSKTNGKPSHAFRGMIRFAFVKENGLERGNHGCERCCRRVNVILIIYKWFPPFFSSFAISSQIKHSFVTLRG